MPSTTRRTVKPSSRRNGCATLRLTILQEVSVEKPKFKLKNDEEIAGLELQSALNFSFEDLEANHDGRLSDAQRANLATAESRWLGTAILSTLAIIWSILNAGGRIDVAVGQGNIAWLIVAAIAAFSWYKWKQYFDDLPRPEIGALQGRVNLDMSVNGKNSTLSLTIQDTQFDVKKDVFLAFKNGDPYAIYYAPHTKTILSAEWLRPE
jgi:hypothetical protein